MSYIGVDLHKTNFVACFLSADDTTRSETYPLTRDDAARRERETRAQAAKNGLHPSGAGDGQPHRYAAGEFLSKEEAGEGCGQGDLRDGSEATDDHFRAAEERTRLPSLLP